MTGNTAIDSITSGYRWVLDSSRTVNWALAGGFQGEYWINPPLAVSELRLAFSVFSYFADINFNYMGSFTNPSAAAPYAQITVSLDGTGLFFNSNNIWALGNFPSMAWETQYSGQAGDIYLNILSPANILPSYAQGSAGFALWLHEIGHTLGLKHTHDDGGTGRPTFASLGEMEFDHDWFSIMSYNDDYRWNQMSWSPASPMALDVLGLMYLYGPNLNTNAGNNVFKLTRNNEYMTLWDASGTDTLDCSQGAESWAINLQITSNPLLGIKVGLATPTSDLWLYAPTTLYWLLGTYENLKGSRYADTLTGNDADNAITGNAGNDALDGGAGIDTAIYSGARSSYTVKKTASGYTVTDKRGIDGIDTLTNFEYLQFIDGTPIAIGSAVSTQPTSSTTTTQTGTSGKDVFTSTSINSIFDGGDGIDTVIYSGSRTSYTIISTTTGHYSIVKASTGNTTADIINSGYDTITNIERLQFADKKIALDITGNTNAGFDSSSFANSGQVYRLYQAAFNRTPDKIGLAYWIEQADSKVLLTTIASGFTNSTEFKNTYGNLTDHQFIDQLYQNVLHRAGEAGGVAYWQGQVDSHVQTREQVLIGFAESAENQAAVIGVIQSGIDYTT